MAIRVSTQLTPRWYTPKSQKDDDRPSRFKVRPLTGEEMNVAAEGVDYDKDTQAVSMTGKTVAYILSRSLLDWENVEGSEGPLACTPSNHQWLPGQDRAEIALNVYVESILSEDQRKN